MTTPQRKMPMVIELSSEQVPGPSRRQFCAHACQAASLVAVGALLPACGGGDDGGNPTSPTTPVDGQRSRCSMARFPAGLLRLRPVERLPRLAAQPWSSRHSAASSLFRSSQTSFTVLTAVCTHEGCTVDHFNGQLYVCPCHGSK